MVEAGLVARQMELDYGLGAEVTIQERDQALMEVEFAVVQLQAVVRGGLTRAKSKKKEF